MPLILLLFTLRLWAADDVDAIIKRLIQAERDNSKRAEQYTYQEETERYIFTSKGKARMTQSETHDVIFVEGLQYKKLVARNDKPLSTREQARVEKDMRQTAEERRRQEHPLPKGGVVIFSGPLSHQSLDLGSLSELLTLFDNLLVGQEKVRGHKTWVIESTPRTGYTPANQHERQVLVFRKKFWVDQSQSTLVRSVYAIAVQDNFFSAGSSLAFEFEKVDADVWEPVSLTLDFSRSKEPEFHPEFRTIYHMSQFKKFDVQSTITVEP
jgi:hypothetical protein